MAENRHGKLTTAEGIHIPYQWEYADATARGAATGFVAADVGKLARQLDTNGLYMLTATTPTWALVGVEATILQEIAPGGRLTLTTATPVTTSDVTAAGTLYYTPFRNNVVYLYSGSAWTRNTFTERSLSLTLTSGKNYDVFLYDNSGTLTLELSAAWTNDTTRADALTTQNGIYVKSGATTRLWLGTIRASGSNTTEDSLLKRFVWNAYNKIDRKFKILDATVSWTYSTAAWRSLNNSTTNRVEFVTGDYTPVSLLYHGLGSTSPGSVGICLDATNSFNDITGYFNQTQTVTSTAQYRDTLFGYHFLQITEYCQSGTITLYGTPTAYVQPGAIGYIPA